MSVSNGQLANQTTFNNAFLSRTVNTSTIGKVDLLNTSGPNSGENVLNVQQHLNDFMQQFKIYLLTDTNEKLEWTGGNLDCPEDLQIRSEDFSVVNTIVAADFPIAIPEGQSLYVSLGRYATAAVTPIVSATLPKGKDIFRICTRQNDALVFWNGQIYEEDSEFLAGGTNGVSSLQVYGDATSVNGDVILQAGSNITLIRSGQTIEITALGGGGGGGGVTYSETEGNVDIVLKPTVETSFNLVSPDLTVWEIEVANDGTISITSGAVGTIANVKVTKPDLSEASFAITDAGELQVISPPAGGETLDDEFFLASPDGTAWRLTATDLNEMQFESDTTLANYFRVKSDSGQVLHQVQEVGGLATHYLPIFDSTSLPASPAAITNCAAWAFYDDGANVLPVYHDGSDWRYFSDDSTV